MEFSDGMKFDLTTELHIENKSDGLYVVGKGMLIPVDSYEEGTKTISEMKRGD